MELDPEFFLAGSFPYWMFVGRDSDRDFATDPFGCKARIPRKGAILERPLCP